ncbi:RE2 [Symbiodinium sp. CCMP2592]|nr:RE2 [Symbiodinium sp. CCMP2592]
MLRESSMALEAGRLSQTAVEQAVREGGGPPVSAGMTLDAPATGWVHVNGAWLPYYMLQGQMVIPQGAGGRSGNAGSGEGGVNGSLPNVGIGPSMSAPPPPPPPPRSPSTPARRPRQGDNSTPGGTPVPPPPPTPATVASPPAVFAGSSEVEEPSKLVTRLPMLAATKGQDAAVVAGDWLAQLEPSMSSLSSSAASWWQALMERVRVLYTRWLESTPILRLQIRQEVLAQRPPIDKYQRVEQRASMLLLDSLPEDLRAEVVSVRAVTVEAMIFLVHCSFQPGGSAEKAYLLQFLTAPESGNSVDSALSLARKWVRLLRRGKELQVVLPDPSLLCRGLDKLHGGVFAGNKHPSAAFRIASFKLERQLDYKAMAKDVEDYAQLILGELEAALLAQPLPSQPKLNRMEETGNADAGKGKGQKPCWGWSDGSGCKYGQNCMFRHDSLGPGRCWVCGSSSHLKPQCPVAGQGGNGSSSTAAGTTSSSTAPSTSPAPPAGKGDQVPEKPGRKPRRKGGGGKGNKDAIRKAEEDGVSTEGGATNAAPQASATSAATTAAPSSDSAREDFFEEAAKALKSLRLARATLDRVAMVANGPLRALVDSGATTSMRTARQRETQGLPTRKVLLAEGEANFYQLPGGTLLTERRTSPIVAMSDLMEIGCRVSWDSAEGCCITHPVRGSLGVQVVNGCPEVDETLGLELIEEAEIIKNRRREAELMVNRLVLECSPEPKLDWDLGAKAVKDLKNGVGISWAWLRRAFPQAPAWLLSAIPVVASMEGSRIPWNRRERKKWRQATAVAVHLFCGRDRATWKSSAEAAHVVTVDQAEDVMADDTYAALLDLALSGKVKMVFGGPPPRTYSALRSSSAEGEGELRPLRDRDGDGRWGRADLSEWEAWRVRQDTIMTFRMIFLWMVATAVARGNGCQDPDFLMEHPEDPQEFLPKKGLASLWAFPEVQFLKKEMKWWWWAFDQGPLGHPRRKPTRVLSSQPCPKALQDVRGPSVVSEEERDADGEGFRAARWAAWSPGLKRAVQRAVEESLAGATLESICKLDGAFLEHLQRDHTPFRRHAHRRIVAPDAWTLSLDLIGPTRQGSDEYVHKIRYGLIGTLVVPDTLGKILQPPDPDGDDEGKGVGLVEDPICDEDHPDPAEAEASGAEAERSDREMERWKARVEKDKLENVTCVEVPFFVPLASKGAAEVLAATKDVLVQVKKLGLSVQRIHTDRGREFINKGFRALCRDRNLVRTTTVGDDFKANGRVEALVGRAKCAVRTYLASSGLGAEMWAFAMRHYTSRIQQQVATQLGARLPRLPPFGTRVFVKRRSWNLKKEEFSEKVVAARVLCPSLDVARGFLVKTDDGAYVTTMVAVENVKEVSGEFEVDAPPSATGEPGVRRRMREKTPAIAKLRCNDQWEEHLIQDEELAETFLDTKDFSADAMDQLLDGLWLSEETVPNRRGETFSRSSRITSHVAGMFRHGGVVGATNLVRHRPALVKFLVEFVKAQLPPGTTFTSLAVNFNMPSQCHKDSNNKPGEKAYLMGFGNYVGGGLWCHDETAESDVRWKKVDACWLPGKVHPTYHQLVTFDPRRLHQPQSWEGNRYVISAYTVGCDCNCSSADRDLLQALGFPLPPAMVQPRAEGGGARCCCGAMKSLRRSKGALRKFCGAFDGAGRCSPGSGEDQFLEPHQVGGDSQGLEEDQILELPQVDGDSQGAGEDQMLEPSQVGGGGLCESACLCKGYEVDPSLCTCRVSQVKSRLEPQVFYIGGDDEALESEEAVLGNQDVGGFGDGAWLNEAWGAYGPPEVPKLKAINDQDEASYMLLGSEVPLEVGWDLFDTYLDDLRLALIQEEYLDGDELLRKGGEGEDGAGSLSRWVQGRADLEGTMEEFSSLETEQSECAVKKVEVTEEKELEMPLHTKTIPNDVVRKEIGKWVPSMVSEYESLVRENDAVEPFDEKLLDQWRREGREFDLVPGKTVHTVKAFTGRLKTRAVICGNFLGQNFSKDQKYAAGADGVLTRILFRMIALVMWSVCVMDVRTAFLLAPLLFQEDRPTLVQVPKMFLLGNVCQERIWRVKRALYGLVTSPRSWEVYRNRTLAEMKGTVPEGPVKLIQSEIDGSLWYIQVGARRAGALICYVDDLLIAGEKIVAQEVARMIGSTWKCTEPQWDDVTFNGFEIQSTEDGLVLRQDSYTKDLLDRYKDLPGYEEVPAPMQLCTEDFELKDGEVAADFVHTAQVMAGELQWLAGRCRPEILYAVNLLSQTISRRPKEAVYRGGHLIKYLKRFPKAGLLYTRRPQVTPDGQVSAANAVIEGYCDASFAPSAERSQQAVMVFVAGGLIAWSSHRQAFVTMSTAESELVAICELATCVKSVEHLVAEIMLDSSARINEVIKVMYSDSQSALAVCRCAAGSWRTRHLRIRGNMIRELLELPNWCAYHVDGKVMLADLGTKALAADRFNMLVDRMRVVRTRSTASTKSLTAGQAKKLMMVLCLAAMVEHGEAAEIDPREPFDYRFVGLCMLAVIAIWECVKGAFSTMLGYYRGGIRRLRSEVDPRLDYRRSGLRRTQEETSLSRSSDPDSGTEDRQEVTSPVISQAAASSTLRNRSRVTGERRPPTPPIPTVTMQAPEPRIVTRPAETAYSFPDPSGKRDRWEWDEANGVVIRWHAAARMQLFVPGQTAGGPIQSQLTGERQTFAKFANGETRVVADNYKELHKPAQTLADREWRGRTELRLVPAQGRMNVKP